MGKSARSRRRFSSRQFRSTPYPTPQPYRRDTPKQCNLKRTSLLERKDWEQSTCSVCMEFPHNAFLLLCSSHDNGCRPYMCGTSHRHSNCLEQFKKAYTKLSCTEYNSLGDDPISPGLPTPIWPLGTKSKVLKLSCPLCRGQVKGWTVVESARKYLNDKKRSCMQDACSFAGTYRELKKHVKSEHPRAKAREIDPEMEERWRVFELERERQDVLSTIMSSAPRSVVFGDYVIEMANGAGIAGDGEDEAIDEDSLLLDRSIMYVLREGARLMRLHWDNDAPEGGGFDPPTEGVADIDGEVTTSDQRRGAYRQNRRRRRRRQGPSPLDVS